MDKKEAIKQFVRKNYALLKQKDEFDKKKYGEIKRVYFGKDSQFKFGIPPDKEICDAFVEMLIRAQRISDKETLQQVILETPFLRLNNIKADDYAAVIDLTTGKYAISDEVRSLSEVERVERELKWVQKEHSREIDRLIQQKEDEYRRLPSILDDTDFEEPKTVVKEVEKREWWELLNLKDNPFPGPLDGFSLIDKNLYDEIIVETPPIKWALRKIKKQPIDIFHKGYLLGGEFGTGKTTFYDFVAPHLTLAQIEPIRIALSQNISEAHYYQDFERRLCSEIAKVAKKYGIPPTSRIVDFEEARILMLEIQDRGVKGFFIFIDDMHKHVDQDRVFNFLAGLQITKNIFTRDGISTAFIVSGFPNWRNKIRQDSALTGFFDAADELTLPEVTPELAAQAITKRLQAFAINPQKELTVKKEFLNAVFKRVSSEIGVTNIGFRPYIQEAINCFSQYKFDILSMDFTKLDEGIAQSLKQALEADNQFADSISRLVFGGRIQKREVREMTLKVLCQVYLMNGITEDETIFDENKFSLKRLEECGLIRKYDRKGQLVWGISPFLHELNKLIIKQFKLSMEDYLVPLYSGLSTVSSERKVVEKQLKAYERELKECKIQLDSTVLQDLETAITMYFENIYKFTRYSAKELESALPQLSDIDRISECVWAMMRGIMRFETPQLLGICGESDIQGWTLRHRSPEYSSLFITLDNSIRKIDSQPADYSRFLSVANNAFDELWSEFKETMSIYEHSLVRCSAIPLDVVRTIYSEHRKLFLAAQPREEYFQSLNKFTSRVEQTLRQYLLVSSALVFGQYQHQRIDHYPQEIRKYITRNIISTSSSAEAINEFENLNRGQYRQLFTEAGKTSLFGRLIISPIIRKWDSHDLTAFFNIFGDANIVSGHLKISRVDELKKEVPTYFRLACRLLSDISARILELITHDNTILLDDAKTFVVFGYRKGLEDRVVKRKELTGLFAPLYEYEITEALNKGEIERIMATSNNRFGTRELDLLDIEETQIRLRARYCESMAVLAKALENREVRIIPSYGTDVHLLGKG